MAKKANEDGYVIRIPIDPWEPIQIFENGYAVVSHLNVVDTVVMGYFRRGIERRQEALFNSSDRVIDHPMMKIEKGVRARPEEIERDLYSTE